MSKFTGFPPIPPSYKIHPKYSILWKKNGSILYILNLKKGVLNVAKTDKISPTKQKVLIKGCSVSLILNFINFSNISFQVSAMSSHTMLGAVQYCFFVFCIKSNFIKYLTFKNDVLIIKNILICFAELSHLSEYWITCYWQTMRTW